MAMVGLTRAMPLERRRVLILFSLASTTPGWPSSAPSSPQIRWKCVKIFQFSFQDIFGCFVKLFCSRSLIKRWPSCRRSCKTPWRRRKTLCCTGMKLKPMSEEHICSVFLTLMDEAIICTYLLRIFGTNEWGNYLHIFAQCFWHKWMRQYLHIFTQCFWHTWMRQLGKGSIKKKTFTFGHCPN